MSDSQLRSLFGDYILHLFEQNIVSLLPKKQEFKCLHIFLSIYIYNCNHINLLVFFFCRLRFLAQYNDIIYLNYKLNHFIQVTRPYLQILTVCSRTRLFQTLSNLYTCTPSFVFEGMFFTSLINFAVTIALDIFAKSLKICCKDDACTPISAVIKSCFTLWLMVDLFLLKACHLLSYYVLIICRILSVLFHDSSDIELHLPKLSFQLAIQSRESPRLNILATTPSS